MAPVQFVAANRYARTTEALFEVAAGLRLGVTMRLNWNGKVSSFASARVQAWLRGEVACTDDEREVARAAHALLVYHDMGGGLGFTPDGTVLFYDFESGKVRPEIDEKWIVIAAVTATEKYSELREILPPRPPTATTCVVCSGAGKQALTPKFTSICGKCFGLGWAGCRECLGIKRVNGGVRDIHLISLDDDLPGP